MTSYGPSTTVPPPPGPGVQPPFAAPPIDGDRTRVWVGLGIGVAALLLCCVTGVAGIAGLALTATQAVNEQAQSTVRLYLDALIKEDYGAAYGELCDAAQRRETPTEFARRVNGSPRVVEYTLYETELGGQQIVVPADVSFTTGTARRLRFLLAQDNNDGRFEVCGVQ